MKTILVTVDSLRYDHYEYMEHTRSFLGDGHPGAYATATATLGTFPNVFTGTYTKSNEIDTSFVEEIDIPTVGITTNRLVSDRYGYDVGFDTFTAPSVSTEAGIKERVAGRLPEGPIYDAVARLYSLYQRVAPTTVGRSFRPAADVIDEFRSAVDPDGEWFGWLHLMDPHHPYDPEEGPLDRGAAQAVSRRAIASGVSGDDADTVRDLYRREVVELDEQLARLWSWLPDDAEVIFPADHGELLGEDGHWGHPGLLREELLHVPFATTLDGVTGPLVSSIDVPTLVLGREY
ncbi:sulfatase, partial [Halobacteriales archaeon SW_7_68_16]